MGLTNPALFCGRQRELEQAVGLLSAPSPACVAIVGPSRIGKTTLLERVVAALPAAGGPAVRAVTLPPLQIADHAAMFRRVARALLAALPQAPPLPAAFGPDDFLELVDQAVGGTPAVLCMDDFEDSTFASEELRSQFYDTLRAATWQRPLGLCLVGRRPLRELCSADGRSRSLLWNVFSTIDLGLLTPADVHELIDRPHAAAGLVVSDDERETVFAEAGTHPCLTQIAGYHLFRAKQQTGGALSQERLYHLAREIRRETSVFFPGFVDYLKGRDRRLVASAFALARRGHLPDDDVDRLTQLGLAYATALGPRLVCEGFEHYLQALQADDAPGTEGNPAVKVFVCHASADSAFTDRLCNELRARGVTVWVDRTNIPPGAMYERSIEAALAAATHVVLVVSPEASASDWVRSEVEWALNAGKKVIPLICRPARLPPRWHTLQTCDATTEEGFAQALDKVMMALAP
jgi:hypothetical protein